MLESPKVSYPTYVRLTRLQEKVIKLEKMIVLLHHRYTMDQLEHLPQYQRLMSLYNSLKPLLPNYDATLSLGNEQVGLPLLI